jgi:hypothetical protein
MVELWKMKNHNKYILILTVLLSISLGFLSCDQDETPGIEFTDFPVEVIYERVGEYISNEENDSGVSFTIQENGPLSQKRQQWERKFSLIA